MDREFAVRPVMRGPPQPRAPTLADTEHVFHLGLMPVGYDHAVIAELLAVRKEDGLAQVAVLDLSFFPPIPLPMEVVDHPLVDMQRGREEVVEPVVADLLVHLASDGPCLAGTLTDDGFLDGGAQGVELLVGLLLEQVQRAYLLALEGQAKAYQEFAVDPAQACVSLGVHLDPPSPCQGQGLIRSQGHLEQRAYPACRDRGQEGKLGLLEGLEVVKRDVALVQDYGEAGGRPGEGALGGPC